MGIKDEKMNNQFDLTSSREQSANMLRTGYNVGSLATMDEIPFNSCYLQYDGKKVKGFGLLFTSLKTLNNNCFKNGMLV